MQVVILEDAKQVGKYAADLILNKLDEGTLKVLGVATGSSPQPVYEALRNQWRPELATLEAFALDEYVGLPYSHPESYHSVINRDVTEPLGLNPLRVHVPDGMAKDPKASCLEYEEAIQASGGIDLQILGIGTTGHIGFNEPTSSFSSPTRIKTLTPETRRDNARFFPSVDDVPVHCITQGLGTIMSARNILLVAHGDNKAEAVARAIEGPITSMCPASILQMHRDATLVIDSAAASQLALKDYYHFVFSNRPNWQM